MSTRLSPLSKDETESPQLQMGLASGTTVVDSVGNTDESVSDPKFSGRLPTGDELSHKSVTGSAGMAYRPFEELGEGGTARVFLARGVGSGGFTKLVVLKMLRKELAHAPEIRQMFQAEARLSARLNHPNLVQVYEVVEGDVPFLVMEYLDGKPLSSMLVGERLPARMLLAILSEALIGLHHAHELADFDGAPLEIVHRDMTPHNILVTYDGAVKVLDFGIAKMATHASHTEVGEVKGKVAYMPPEQLLGEKIDRRADIFAVGCMLWEAATGSRMWENLSEANVMHRLATGDIPNPRDRVPIDPELERIIRKATAAAPADRYATALDLQRDVAYFLAATEAPPAMREIGAALAKVFEPERLEHKRKVRAALRYLAKQDREAAGLPKTEEETTAPTPAPRSRGRTLGIAALVLLLGAGAAASVWRFVKARPPEVVAPAAALTATISIRAVPAQGTIEVDGKELGTGAVAMNAAVDGKEHVIRVSAPGYQPETRIAKFEHNLDLEILLEKVVARPPEPAVTAKPAAPPSNPPPHIAVTPKPKAASPAQPKPEGCNPPYYFNQGIKVYKPQCL